MANRYWAAGVSGNWNNTASWSSSATGTPAGASVPGSSDSAIFNAASGTVTATLDISPDIQTLTMTGFTGTLAFGTNTISLNSIGTIFTGSTTTTVTGTPQIICTSTTAVSLRTITPTAVTEANSISFRVTAGTAVVSITAGSVRDLDFTDGTNPTGYAGALGNSVVTIYGNFKASTGMTRTAGTSSYTFAATSGTKTITTAAVVFDCPFNFNGVGGTWQLQDALTSGAGRTCTLTAGTLDLNGYTLTTGLLNASNANTRTLAFGTGKIVVIGTSGSVFSATTSTGLTVTGTNPLVQATVGGAGTRTISLGNVGEANAISVDVTAGSDIISLSTTSGAYKNVNFTGFTGTVSIANSIIVYGNWNYGGTTIQGVGTGTVTFAATSGTKTITSNGFSFPGNVTFNGVGGTWQLQDAMTTSSTVITTLTNGTLNLNGYTLTTGSFYSDNTNIRVLAFGTGKIVVTSNNSAPFNVDNALNFSYTGTSNIEAYYTGAVGVRYLVIGNTTGGSEAVAMNLKVTVGTDTVYIYKYWNNLDFTGFAGTYGNLGFKIFYGSFTLVSGMTVEPVAGAETLTFAATSGPKTITSAGKTIDYPTTFDGVGGTWAMQDAFTLGATQPLTFTNGTVQLKSGTTSTVGSFVTTGTNQKFLQSTTPGSQATISDASGTDSVSYLTIQDSNATGGATWYALAPSVDAGNNTGWIFIPTPADSDEITMRLRSFTQPRRF